MVIFEVFLPVREPLVAIFEETCAVTSPKDIVKQDMKISKTWEKQITLVVATFSETNAVTSKKEVVKQGMKN